MRAVRIKEISKVGIKETSKVRIKEILVEIINVGSRIVNTYILKGESCNILVDTGYNGNYSAFCTKLAAHGIGMEEIDYIFLTHAHDDHAGFLNEVLAHSHAKIIMHPAGLTSLRNGQNSFEGGCSGKLALVFCKFMGLMGKGEHRYPTH